MSRQDFLEAQERVFRRYGVNSESRLVAVPSIAGHAHVIVTGEGPPVFMVIGGGIVAGTWAPLMAELTGYTLHAVDLPGQGLTDPTRLAVGNFRTAAVSFLEQVMDGLDLETAPFVGQSTGGTWSTWMALDRPERVSAISYVACPAAILGTSAPFPLRLGTIPWINRLVRRLDPPSTKQVERLGKMAGEPLSDKPELRDLMLEYQRLPGTDASLLEMHRALVRLRGPQPATEMTESQIARVATPVQFIWGENDPFGPPSVGVRAVEVMPAAELHVVPGGHAPWFGHPEGVGAIVRPFLAKHTTGVHT
ncbi:MAG TPA: alpha/beta hydrolase [Acidimicrobiia bacterium]